jgi:hypothetical protein
MLVIAAGFDRIAELAKEQATLQEHWRLCLKASRHLTRTICFAKRTIRKAALRKRTPHVPTLAVQASTAKSTRTHRIHHRGRAAATDLRALRPHALGQTTNTRTPRPLIS